MKPETLLYPTPKGLFCEAGGFYIDPVHPVDKALITHGHADHARSGHGEVLATRETLEIMAIRYGADFCRQPQEAALRETMTIGDVTVSFHPAGHVLGSAQIAVSRGGTKIVVSGDYKRRRDPTCLPFEPVPCDVFITEATFGLPVFHHPPDADEVGKLLTSLRQFPERAHLVGAYALGKAQRVIMLLREAGYHEPIYIHGALVKLCDYYLSKGIPLGELRPATVTAKEKPAFAGAVVIGPPSAFADKWARRFPDPIPIFASGWMLVRQRAKQRGVELPIIISDHCDWAELTDTIREIRPGQVWVTHGREEALVRWCELEGIKARPLHLVGYDDEGE
ncbi:DNA ligase-associated DEXH box helicase [Rhizobium sp. Leaf384]|uniref:ligase-associated DNA damage response exonuclease n=1 Tax=unclassified Rhizobium TaxID=2613769 RepID=UPI000712F42B|nr:MULTISPECIES: ligase-associated DNA damage response exonuclease [unclassified Rhizobium]KQR75978.1 DNA ligase-associated DEXH box helicase [Rhizobium sp. Leaf341]KQS76589.1 DNA ligase-associated DEXH box helicase [Rhizobium sp. Leaf383]KQS77858.1 DNA ligase-associated DEXH box helicase [Rhizobium sp. Leaf384]